MIETRRHIFDQPHWLPMAGELAVKLSHQSVLAWPSTWVLAVSLLLAPGVGPSGLLAPLPAMPTVEIPISSPIPLTTAIELASPFQATGAFPLTLPQAEPDVLVSGLPVTITAYTSEPAYTDDEPFVTATGRMVRPGTLALSRDLLRTFTPGAPFDFGDRVRLSRFGEFVVDDTMNPRWSHRVDIWLPTVAEAQEFGKRHGRMFLLESESSEDAPRGAAAFSSLTP